MKRQWERLPRELIEKVGGQTEQELVMQQVSEPAMEVQMIMQLGVL